MTEQRIKELARNALKERMQSDPQPKMADALEKAILEVEKFKSDLRDEFIHDIIRDKKEH